MTHLLTWLRFVSLSISISRALLSKYEHARYPDVANHEHPPGIGTTRGASTPGHGHYSGFDPGLPLCYSCSYPSMCSYPCLSIGGGGAGSCAGARGLGWGEGRRVSPRGGGGVR